MGAFTNLCESSLLLVVHSLRFFFHCKALIEAIMNLALQNSLFTPRELIIFDSGVVVRHKERLSSAHNQKLVFETLKSTRPERSVKKSDSRNDVLYYSARDFPPLEFQLPEIDKTAETSKTISVQSKIPDGLNHICGAYHFYASVKRRYPAKAIEFELGLSYQMPTVLHTYVGKLGMRTEVRRQIRRHVATHL